ncbi:TetR family transcriptional regulator [Acetobacterium paludosum]|uniref:TetR family transcriptional regulator n=1 Tax=Acetobacterium paludosum TaxID=52693 RepID=A0A923HTJ5_9FIRM|nr:TetR/AcrR family transcriptional regulator [Acetobacterium paludosum]MBC3886932.1 TetR family transcriptional regulator [Acetobacterium paludosum]
MGAKKKDILIQFNRDIILASARKLFQLSGINRTSMDEIAREADCSKSTIYVYFKNKDEIINYIVYEHMVLLRDALQECTPDNKDFERSYYAICNTLVDFQEQYPLYFESLLSEIDVEQEKIQQPGLLADIYKAGEQINDIIGELLKSGIEHNCLRENLELIPTVFYLWSSISGIILLTNQKQKYLKMRVGMDKTMFLNYSFKTLLQSIIK